MEFLPSSDLGGTETCVGVKVLGGRLRNMQKSTLETMFEGLDLQHNAAEESESRPPAGALLGRKHSDC